MALRQRPVLARWFPLLSLLGICVVGILLYLLHSAVLTVQRVDFEYTKAFSLIDELRTDSRRLTSLVHRATASKADLDISKEFQHIIKVREGHIARSPTMLVAPGIAVSFLSLVDSLSLTTLEQELLLKAYDISQALAVQEQQAIHMVAHIDIDDMASPAARATVRQAVHIVTSKEYTNRIEELQRSLEGVLQSITDRMREDNNQSHQYMNVLILGICLVLFMTLGSLVVMAHAPQIPTSTRSKLWQPRRIYLYIILLLTLAFAVPIAFIYTDAHSTLVNALEKRQALICNEVYSELNLRATQALELAKIVAIRPPVRTYIASYNANKMQASGSVQALEVLQTFTNNYTDIACTLLLDKAGKILISTSAQFSPTTTLLSPKILERVMAGESFIATVPTPLASSFSTSNFSMNELIVVTPVFASPPLESTISGAIVSILDRHNSFRLWEGRLAAEEHMNIFILNQDGTIILSSRGVERFNTKLLYERAAKIVQAGGTGLHYYTDGQGVSRIGFFRLIPELGWTVAATSSYVTLTASVREILLRAGIFGIFSILATIILFSLLMQRMTASLRATNQRMDDIVDSAGMFTYDLDVPTGEFIHNARWCHFWQYPGPAMKGTKNISFVLERLHPQSVPIVQGILAHKRAGEAFTIDFQIYTCKGETRWCRQMGRIESCDAQGLPTRIIGTGFDITAQKIAEESSLWHSRELEKTVILRTAELEESRNQAEAASQAKTIFLSTVSHEIRTPMNAIVGFAHIFDRTNLTSKQKEQLEKIKLSAAALLGVINDVLDISKIEAGKLEIERTPFYLHSLLDTVCSIVDFATSEKDLILTVNVAPDVPEMLIGDPKRISQILLNLMNNAVKFTTAGSITLNVSLDDSVPDDTMSSSNPTLVPAEGTSIILALSVTDTGIGLSPDQITRLFKPFMQADSSVTRRFGGTGLGLAITKQLVELMGGSIGVNSAPGLGSTFYFTLRLTVPATDTDALVQSSPTDTTAAKPEYTARLQALSGLQVLVVEDNDINQEIAAALLQELGIEPDMADDGMQALSMAPQKHYHCILMDMQMPIMGGLEATQRLRTMGTEATNDPNATDALRWLAHVPIIAMTANAMAEDRQRCIDAGMNDHISKPIDPETLQNCMLRWLEATTTKLSP